MHHHRECRSGDEADWPVTVARRLSPAAQHRERRQRIDPTQQTTAGRWHSSKKSNRCRCFEFLEFLLYYELMYTIIHFGLDSFHSTFATTPLRAKTVRGARR
jgi:hypothetical protein